MRILSLNLWQCLGFRSKILNLIRREKEILVLFPGDLKNCMVWSYSKSKNPEAGSSKYVLEGNKVIPNDKLENNLVHRGRRGEMHRR